MQKPWKALAVVTPVLAAACVTIFQSGQVDLLPASAGWEPRRVESPMKAFLLDGSTILFPAGAVITVDSVLGSGTRHSFGLDDSVPVSGVSLDSLAGIEAFQGSTNQGATVAATIGLTALGVVGTVALAKALFGSCPTFYASSETGGALQSEGFSYSIAPLLEARDLDALSVVPDADGVLRLELRNEALETHYINHLEVLALDHAPGVRMMPDDLGLPIAVGQEVDVMTARDRAGRDVTATLARADGDVYASPAARIASANAADPDDFLELRFPRPAGSEAVLTLRLRNSLLNTVLFYDMMLGQAGAGAVDWIGQDMDRIGTLVEMGRWFQDAMGLRVDVFDGREWVQVSRLTDTGPIAWEEVGVRIPLSRNGSHADDDDVRVRIRFLTDAWRIDRAALGTSADFVEHAPLAVARMVGSEPIGPDVAPRLARPDDEYLTTYPGTSVQLEFDPPPAPPGASRSYLLVSQGYYTEWVRPEWIRGTDRPGAFKPDDTTIERLMAMWLSQKEEFEADFHNSRIPVR